MPTLTMPLQTLSRLALFTENEQWQKKFASTGLSVVSTSSQLPPDFLFDVVAVDVQSYLKFNQELLSKEKIKRLVLFAPSEETMGVDFFSGRQPDVFMNIDDLSFENLLQIKEKVDQEEQDSAFLYLASDLNKEYETLKEELETKISQHQKSLLESRQKILESNNRSEALRKILYSLHQENDITRLETILNELLPSSTSVTWVKIVLNTQQDIFEKDIQSQLDLSFHKCIAQDFSIYFIKGDKKSFRKSDTEFFEKIRDALDLNIKRNQDISDLVLAEKILSTAFSSFKLPLALIDENFEVHQSNPQFHGASTDQQGHCYAILFQRESPCVGCQLGQNFKIENQSKIFEVSSSRISSGPENQSKFLNIYKDVSEQILFEQRMTQNAKMNDLGLISGSIAHELNNPLGGIISYLQILQMEMPKDHILQKDLQDMVSTSLRMKKIIEDLLVFSRRPKIEEKTTESLSELVEEVLQLNELALKSENIKVVNQIKNISIEVSKSAFRDSLYLILNFFMNRSRSMRQSGQRSKQSFTGLIEIKLDQDQIKNNLQFVGNFGPLEDDVKSKNVGFLAIHKTLVDQGFQVELTEENKTWVAIHVIFQKSGN